MGKGESIEIKEIVDEALKIFEKKILLELNSITDETKRYLYFIAWINRFIEDRGLGKIIITGGFAVELYTARIYRTMDVDIIIDGCKEVVEEFLKRFSEKIGRGYIPTYEIISLKSIDIVSTVYSRAKPPTKILVNELYVYVDPVEDLITTYLAGWKHWNSTEDRDKALWLLAVWKEKIDWNYLNGICRDQNVLDKLIELLEILRKNPLKNNPSI